MSILNIFGRRQQSYEAISADGDGGGTSSRSKPRKLPVKIEPKVYFANERTFPSMDAYEHNLSFYQRGNHCICRSKRLVTIVRTRYDAMQHCILLLLFVHVHEKVSDASC